MTGIIFNKEGNMFSIHKVDEYVSKLGDELLVSCYVHTIYFHELTLAMEELVEKGFAEKNENNEEYNPKLTNNSISSIKNEILKRFDKDYHDYLLNKVDLSVLKNKPKGL